MLSYNCHSGICMWMTVCVWEIERETERALDPAVGTANLEEHCSSQWGKATKRPKVLLEKILLLSEIAVIKLLTPKLYCSFSQHRQFEPLSGSAHSHSSVLMQYFNTDIKWLCELFHGFMSGNAAIVGSTVKYNLSCEAVLAVVFMNLQLMAGSWDASKCSAELQVKPSD